SLPMAPQAHPAARHSPARPSERAADPQAGRFWAPPPSEPGENGEGTLTFHYSNKSTDANLAIDLGTTDLYLEMTGKPAEAMVEEAKAIEREQDPRPPAPRKKASRPETRPAPQDEPEEAPPSRDPEPQRDAARPQPHPQPGAQDPRGPAKPEAPLPEDDPGGYEDVTAKVLTGIRKAQELFYQKRYPEAMQAVRSSLDARSTAEGHALAGSIHYMQGQGGMARREWMEALRLNPDLPAVVNMLEKTRTPGGRGSPNPRPIQPRPRPLPRPAALPLPPEEQAPFPEEYDLRSEDAPVPAPVRASPAAPEAVPAPAAAPAAAPAPTSPATAPAAPPQAPAPSRAAAGENAAVPKSGPAPAAPKAGQGKAP
ncbi:MAG TPA: hypothetical protein VJ385_10060, partial [Fibrobacteria bacterium]|nr:hypothetical protein [Fibrobacteria bacterium]